MERVEHSRLLKEGFAANEQPTGDAARCRGSYPTASRVFYCPPPGFGLLLLCSTAIPGMKKYSLIALIPILALGFYLAHQPTESVSSTGIATGPPRLSKPAAFAITPELRSVARSRVVRPDSKKSFPVVQLGGGESSPVTNDARAGDADGSLA